jgi:hypothetical protein
MKCQMNEHDIFVVTKSGSNGLSTDIRVLDTEKLVAILKLKGFGYEQIRHVNKALEERVRIVSNMRLAEFERVFRGYTIPKKQVTKHFSKEISVVYGEHRDRVSAQRIPKKELVVGQCYETDTGSKYFYFGKIKYQSNKAPCDHEVFLYNRLYSHRANTLEDLFIHEYSHLHKSSPNYKPIKELRRIDTLKTQSRKFVKLVEGEKIEVPRKARFVAEKEHGADEWIEVEFLDNKEREEND